MNTKVIPRRKALDDYRPPVLHPLHYYLVVIKITSIWTDWNLEKHEFVLINAVKIHVIVFLGSELHLIHKKCLKKKRFLTKKNGINLQLINDTLN